MDKTNCAICNKQLSDSGMDSWHIIITPCAGPSTETPEESIVCKKCMSGHMQCRACNTIYHQSVKDGWIVPVNSYIFCNRKGCLDSQYWSCSYDHSSRWAQAGRSCDECGRDSSGRRPRCGCGNGGGDSPIHNYSCQPTLVFHDVDGQYDERTKPRKMFLGFELEIQIPGDKIAQSAMLFKTALQDAEIAQSKSDGSIGGGIELVTQPHTYLKYREQHVLFDAIDKCRTLYGGRSWDPGTCGFHIHLGRDGFADGRHMHRFVEMVYRNSEMMMKFGGRKSGYAKFDDCWEFDEFDRPVFSLVNKGLMGSSANERGGEKYAAVNTGKAATIEMRFMRGSTKKETILSYLGMADAIAEYTREIPTSNNWWDWETFGTWVTSRSSVYPELFARFPSIKDLKISDLDKLKIKA